MSDSRKIIDDEQLDKVVGGLFVFHKKSQYVTFTHQDGTVTNHNVLDYDKAWTDCCNMEGQNVPEDQIFQHLIKKGYIDSAERN